MDEIIYQKSYQEYKAELDGELQRTAEGFVRIGYLLKVARDTNVLAESQYKTVAEFAEAEYNLDKTQVSRFININDKFSEGGYSDRLRSEYQGYGYAKLTIMLQLPDAINEELSPNFSKAEIQAIREEIAEEQAVSDIERMIETPNKNETNLEGLDEHSEALYKAILQLGEDDPELYVAISKRKSEDLSTVLPDVMAPAGDKMYSIRVRGVGRLMLSISDMSDTVKLINSRSGEKQCYTWDDVAAAWIYAGIFGSETEQQTEIECWEQRYERKYPIAPVQQPKLETKQKPAKKETKKETKVKKASKDWASIYHKGQQIKVYENDHIGELIEKTEETGKWKVKFPTYTAEMNEGQFTEYIEEIPESEETTEKEESEEKAEVAPVQQDKKEWQEPEMTEKKETEPETYATLPGQLTTEDIPELTADIANKTESENVIDGEYREIESASGSSDEPEEEQEKEECKWSDIEIKNALGYFEVEYMRMTLQGQYTAKCRNYEIAQYFIKKGCQMIGRSE